MFRNIKALLLNHNISTKSALLLNFVSYSTLYIIFTPTIIELSIFILIDICLIFLLIKLHNKLHLKNYPILKDIYFDNTLSSIKTLKYTDKKMLLEALLHFPITKIRYLNFLNIFKTIILLVVVLLAFKHDNYFWQAIYFVSISLLFNLYFKKLSFIEMNHIALDYIKRLHELHDLSDIFFTYTTSSKTKFNFLNSTMSAFMLCLILTITITIILIHKENNYLIPNILIIFILSLLLLFRVRYLTSKYLYITLDSLLSKLSKIEFFNPHIEPVILYPSEFLFNIAKIINTLIFHNKSYQKEFTNIINTQVELSRYNAIGEVSALVVHDLSSPLNIIQMYIDLLKDNPNLIKQNSFQSNLKSALDRSIELINSLKAYLTHTVDPNPITNIGEAHKDCLDLLALKFGNSAFSKIKITSDDEILIANVKYTKTDLIHILYNLYSNSIEHLINNKIINPYIKINLVEYTQTSIIINIQDNGMGLTQKQFEILTTFNYQDFDDIKASSLGLRLIRRLIEKNGDSIQVIDSSNMRGTIFQLKLKTPAATKLFNNHNNQ